MECIVKVPKNGGGKYVYFAETANAGCHKIRSNQTTTKIQLRNKSVIKDECQLMNGFINGRRLPHDEWFGLATNLIGIMGGQNIFTNTINKYSDLYGNTDFKIEQMEYAARMSYKPQNCDNFCPYSDECPHETNIIFTLQNRHRIMKRISDYSETFYDIQTIWQEVENFFYNAVLSESSVCVLKAPTGSGKSTAHLKFFEKL